MIRDVINTVLRRLGYVISRYKKNRDPLRVEKTFFDIHEINVVLDIGANEGQYAKRLRESGFSGKIVSFEPLCSAYEKLKSNATNDANWVVRKLAVGKEEKEDIINVAGNSWSSSLLDMLPRHEKLAPGSGYKRTEKVNVVSLDSVINQYVRREDKVFLKIDAQGYTQQILDGAIRTLDDIVGLQVEMSLMPLYKGEPLIGDVVARLYRLGFVLVLVKPEFIDEETGQQLQIDGLFFRVSERAQKKDRHSQHGRSKNASTT